MINYKKKFLEEAHSTGLNHMTKILIREDKQSEDI